MLVKKRKFNYILPGKTIFFYKKNVPFIFIGQSHVDSMRDEEHYHHNENDNVMLEYMGIASHIFFWGLLKVIKLKQIFL